MTTAHAGSGIAQTTGPFLNMVLPSIPQNAIPQPALLLVGGLGGPLVVAFLTPLRNACVLSSQDSVSSAVRIVRHVFSGGVRSGWTGASFPARVATIQFTMLGCGYHFYLGLLGSPVLTVVATGLSESLVGYGAATRNAQLMHNQVATKRDRVLVRPIMPVGPGFTALWLRDCLAMTGIRVCSDPLACTLQWMSGADASSAISPGITMGGDFLASVLCGTLSMPFNQTACLTSTPAKRAALALRFLKSQYLMKTASGFVRLRQTMLRDALLRSSYLGCLFCCFSSLERLAFHVQPSWIQ
eukprot:CAMPEP_0172929032 /NCGR_PEP_ID=MMETSP1075-20121228/218277_1 /TAXON_ID=2916 /ORGANISM="Ceratium fusus, Strain PA161109" /LENGTH=298 /DNA_ID=CAMNT_0013790321 /DNA_START=30 /DNA_END=926 /DNA_ORIENTATION=-